MQFPEYQETRSQDLPEVLHDAGQFYWADPETWASGVKLFAESSTVVRIARWRVQDIDTEEDWIHAEAIARYLQQSDGEFGSAIA
jgi:N-acylneuraminate cytidylyltransferase